MSAVKTNKSLYSDSLLLFLVRFFSNAATLTVMIYFSHQLATADYGRYQNFWVYLTVLSTIATAGIALLLFTYTPATLRYIVAQIKPLYGWLYLGILLLVGCSFGVLVRQGYGVLTVNTLILALFFCVYVVNVILDVVLMVHRKFLYLLVSGFIYSAGLVMLHISNVREGFDFDRLLLSFSLLVAIKCSFGAVFSYRAMGRVDSRLAVPIHLLRVRALWLQLFTFESSQMILRFLDKLIVSFIVSRELSAIYFNGTVDIPFLPIMLTAVSNAGSLYISKSSRTDSLSHLKIIQNASSIMATVSFSLFAYLFVFRVEFISAIFSEKYLLSIPIFAFALLKLLPNVFTLPFYLQYKQRANLINKGALIDILITLALIYPAYVWLGLPGIVLSFVVSSFVQGGYYTFCAAKLLKVPVYLLLPLKNWLGKMIAFLLLAYISHFFINGLSNSYAVLTYGGLPVALVSVAWLWYEYKKAKKLSFAEAEN